MKHGKHIFVMLNLLLLISFNNFSYAESRNVALFAPVTASSYSILRGDHVPELAVDWVGGKYLNSWTAAYGDPQPWIKIEFDDTYTISKIREYFEVLRKFNFIYHCYFIIGNIGETRGEMLDIIKFSHDLGIDSLGLSVLRVTKYSPLKDMLKRFDDYHIEQGSGKVYSDMLSVDELQQIRRDVNASFFTIPVILRILKKLIIHRLLTLGRVYKIIIYAARRKIKKIAQKRAILMGNVIKR